ncbi:MAG TPA: DUF4249 family protein, partial [Segetibacter sp.]
MVSKKLILIALITLIASFHCIKKLDVDTRTEKPILVVEGAVSTDSVPYTVNLSYSGPFDRANKIPDEYFEDNAIVTISTDDGNTTLLKHIDKGLYETTDSNFIGKVGTSYSVTVVLKDG